jgi:predicted hydrocarbon binding protein
MKGVLFNVVEDVVTETLSADAWDDVLDAAGVPGSYTSLGTYPDAELGAIVQATAELADLSVDDTFRLAGRLGFRHLASRNQALVDRFGGWRELISSLDDIIHPDVRKVYADSEVPGFVAVDAGDALHVTYTSQRSLCALAEGLMAGAGAWFDREVSVEHQTCVHRGDDACVLLVREVGATE